MKRKKRDDRQLFEFSKEHLLYEVQMLYGSSFALMSRIDDWVFRMAALEAFVIHLRNLLDFFYSSKNARKDHAIAEDFFDDSSTWLNQRPQKTQLLIETATREPTRKLLTLHIRG